MEGAIKDSTENPRGFGGRSDPEPELNADGEEMPTEEEQLNFDLLTIRGTKMIFGDGKTNILKMLGTSEAPAKGLGKVAAILVKTMMRSAKEGGRDITGDVALQAGAEIITDLNELAKAKGVYQYDSPEDEEKEIADAMLWGVKFYGDGMLKNGEVTPELQNMAKKGIQEGVAEERAMQPDKVNAAVKGAIDEQQQPKSPGIINGAAQAEY